MSMLSNSMNWKIAEAKQRFSEVVRQASDGPQLVYNRERMVAAVIDAATYQAFAAWHEERNRRSLADAFDELRRIAPASASTLRQPRRRDRRNEFLDALDELSR
jgi:prevent-host-death family protein